MRLFNTVGPRQTGRYGMVIPTFVGQALRGEPITVYGAGEQSRCFGNVRDVTAAVVKLIGCPESEGEVVNLGSDEEITINGLAERIRELLDSPSEIVHIPYNEAYEEGFEDMSRRVPCLEKAHRLIGYQPTIKLDETIHQVAEPCARSKQTKPGSSIARHGAAESDSFAEVESPNPLKFPSASK